KTVPAEMPLSEFRSAFPLGSETRLIAVDGEGRYAGIIIVPEAHAPDLAEATTIRDLLRNGRQMLLRTMTVKSAIEAFDQAEAEALAVVDSKVTCRPVG